MLMWYGADISLAQSRNSKYNPSYISIHANPGATVRTLKKIKIIKFFEG